MTVVKLSPGKRAEVLDIPHTLEAMQQQVGGYIEAIYPFEDAAAIICNEEGKLLGLEPNRAIRDSENGELLDIVCGTCFVCGLSENDFCSLTPEQMKYYSELYQYPELFLWDGSRIIVVKETKK